MKKFLIFLVSLVFTYSVFAVGEKTPTSKSYIDSAVAQKQDRIERTAGANQALTNTGVAGEYGTKDIYDSNGSYLEQMDALVDAATMNAGVQKAIETEFQCVEYNPNDPTDCWLMDIRSETGQSILPAGYTALEYLESTGTQYINTGISGLNIGNWEIYVKWMVTSVPEWTAPFILSTNEDNNGQSYRVMVRKGFANQYIVNCNSRNGSGDLVVSNKPMNAIHTATVQNGSVLFDGIRYSINVQGDPISADKPICILGSCSFSVRRMIGRIYESWAKKDDVYMYNFVPARRNSDGKLGMYDFVTNTFFLNSGTGEFIAGPVINLYMPSGN